MKQKADWLTGQTKGGPDPAQAPRLGGIHHQSLDQVSLTYLPRYLGSIMSASRTTVQEYRLTATYCVSRGASYSAAPPPQACQSPLSKFYEDSCRQSAACASNSHRAGQHHCESCRLTRALLPAQTRPWKRVFAPPIRPCRAPTPKNTTATKAVNSCSEQSPWQRAAPRCATSRSPH